MLYSPGIANCLPPTIIAALCLKDYCKSQSNCHRKKKINRIWMCLSHILREYCVLPSTLIHNTGDKGGNSNEIWICQLLQKNVCLHIAQCKYVYVYYMYCKHIQYVQYSTPKNVFTHPWSIKIFFFFFRRTLSNFSWVHCGTNKWLWSETL